MECLNISRDSTKPGRYTKVYRSNRRSGLILDPNLCVDTELRDVALQCIYYIVDSSDEMKLLFCAEPHCLNRVLNICNEDTHQGLSCAVATAIVACFSVRLYFYICEVLSIAHLVISDIYMRNNSKG